MTTRLFSLSLAAALAAPVAWAQDGEAEPTPAAAEASEEATDGEASAASEPVAEQAEEAAAPDAGADAEEAVDDVDAEDSPEPAEEAAPRARFSFDPATDAFELAVFEDRFARIDQELIPTGFLRTEGLTFVKYGKVRWAWFSSAFKPSSYESVAVAPARNDLGRARIVGQKRAAEHLVTQLGKIKTWKGKVSEGTEADLVIHISYAARATTWWYIRTIVELVGVDAKGGIVFQMQFPVSYNGTDELVAGAMGGWQSAASAIPDQKDQFKWLETISRRTARVTANAFRRFEGELLEGNAPVGGAAVGLGGPRTDFIGTGENTQGPTIVGQVERAVATASDSAASVDEREEALKLLANIGHADAVPALITLMQDRDGTPKRVRDTALWALGEIGDASAVDAIQAVRGLPKVNRKVNVEKITKY